ncbi:tail fiber protein [Aquimarina longa]|uniref:tail fiber protein n=1 Tax=Aquimarina longa TaxID=1080221 RepID=UPI000781D3BD|nr:tail fiber protein [Aquimarina longa]
MKKILFVVSLIGFNFIASSQISYVNGETKLINPTGRTLIIEKNDNDSWLTFHDPGNFWYSMGIDVSNSGLFSLNTGGELNSSQFVMDIDGNIGVGISKPTSKLMLQDDTPIVKIFHKGAYQGADRAFGELRFINNYDNLGGHRASIKAINTKEGSESYVGLEFSTSTHKGNRVFEEVKAMTIDHYGNIGVGISKPTSKLMLQDDTPIVKIFHKGTHQGVDRAFGELRFINNYDNLGGHRASIKAINTKEGSESYVGLEFSTSTHEGNRVFKEVKAMTIDHYGNVGIGTPKPDSKLTVKGKIHAEEVKIDLSIPAPDYVFRKDYNLKSIEEVEDFIKKNSHLPGIPSAKEFKQNGVMLAEMDMNLLKKIEELVLYTIAQEKKIKSLEKQNSKIEKLEKDNKELKSIADRLLRIEKHIEAKKK